MVVVVIIGVLVAIAIPVYNTVTAQAERRACSANLRMVDGAYQTLLAADGTLPAAQTWAALMTVLVGNYLVVEPRCPSLADGAATVYSWTAAAGARCATAVNHNYRPAPAP